MPLFLVDHDMRLAAMETFYFTAHFRLRHDQLGATLDFFPKAALPYVRNVTIALTSEQCYHWTGSPPSPEVPKWYLDQVRRIYFPKGGSEGHNGQAGLGSEGYLGTLKAVLSTLATASTTRIQLELDLSAARIFAEMYSDGLDLDNEDRFRWVYDLYQDVASVVRGAFEEGKSARRLGSVKFRLGIFTDLEPWLEKEVMGEGLVGTVVREGTRMFLWERVPGWHVG